MTPVFKSELRAFVARNPYPGPRTDGLFFHDKMKAIHSIAPDMITGDVLEIGGGRSGLTKLLYPDANLTTVDRDASHGCAAVNHSERVQFVAADAAALPFPDNSFSVVTMFDLLEHVPDDAAAASEALRVVQPGGSVLITTPHRVRWRYPYYSFMRPIARPEGDLLREWGHVRRGYTLGDLEALFGQPAADRTSFINPLVAISHDIAFSTLPRLARLVLHALAAPVSIIGIQRQLGDDNGIEIAVRFQKVNVAAT